MNETDQVTLAKEGDEAAWGGLVGRHQEAVFRLAYLLLGNAEDAEEVAQEVFIRAYRAFERFDATRPLRPWLLEITRNQCYNWGRSLRRYLTALQQWRQAAPTLQLDAQVDLDQHAIQQWQAKTLWQAVRRLRYADQEVIYLRFFMDLSVEETAQVLNVAAGTVKSRLWRALERLRQVVEQEFPGLREEPPE